LSELFAALIGLVAGGLVTGAVQVFQTSQARRLKRRVAARLISGDLITAELLTDAILEHDRWPSPPMSFDAERDRWFAQREAFAAGVSAFDWFMVESVYDHLATLADMSRPAQPLSTDDRAAIEKQRKRLKVANSVTADRGSSRREAREVVRKWNELEIGKRPGQKP
jgi:hypothetical protein